MGGGGSPIILRVMLVQLFVEEQHEVSFENFEAVFAAVVLPSIGGDRMQLGWEAIKGSS